MTPASYIFADIPRLGRAGRSVWGERGKSELPEAAAPPTRPASAEEDVRTKIWLFIRQGDAVQLEESKIQ